jgi:hypothetical protein
MNFEETHVETDPFLLLSRQYYDGSAIFKKKVIFKQIDESVLAAYNYTERQELFSLYISN